MNLEPFIALRCLKATRKGLFAVVVLSALALPASAAGLDAAALSKILGRPLVESNGELKTSVPRTDLDVSLDGFKITPAMGLTAWIALTPHGDQAALMGDLVLTERQFVDARRRAWLFTARIKSRPRP